METVSVGVLALFSALLSAPALSSRARRAYERIVAGHLRMMDVVIGYLAAVVLYFDLTAALSQFDRPSPLIPILAYLGAFLCLVLLWQTLAPVCWSHARDLWRGFRGEGGD